MSSPLWCCTLSCSMVHSTTSRSRLCTCFFGGHKLKNQLHEWNQNTTTSKGLAQTDGFAHVNYHQNSLKFITYNDTKRHNLNYTLLHVFICLFFCSPLHQCGYTYDMYMLGMFILSPRARRLWSKGWAIPLYLRFNMRNLWCANHATLHLGPRKILC